jgi:hypothetical protein
MFVAKFSQTSAGGKFKDDKNDIFPFIGTIVAGTAKGSVVNGTIFLREKYEIHTLYLCENTVDPEYPDNVQTNIISKVSILEFMELRTTLGAGKLVREEVGAGVAAEA